MSFINEVDHINARFDLTALSISQLISDTYCISILSACSYVPRSAHWLSDYCNIPIAACYRRIKTLEKNGLLTCIDRPVSEEGRRNNVYKSHVKKIKMLFEKGKFKVEMVLDSFPSMVESEWELDINRTESEAIDAIV